MPNELPAPASMVFLKKLGRVSYSDGEGLPSSGLISLGILANLAELALNGEALCSCTLPA